MDDCPEAYPGVNRNNGSTAPKTNPVNNQHADQRIERTRRAPVANPVTACVVTSSGGSISARWFEGGGIVAVTFVLYSALLNGTIPASAIEQQGVNR